MLVSGPGFGMGNWFKMLTVVEVLGKEGHKVELRGDRLCCLF